MIGGPGDGSQRGQGDLSFTDCVSFAVMKRLGIGRAAAFDRHFSRAGFKMAK